MFPVNSIGLALESGKLQPWSGSKLRQSDGKQRQRLDLEAVGAEKSNSKSISVVFAYRVNFKWN